MDKSCMELSEEWNIVPVDYVDIKKKIETEGDSSIANVIERGSDSHDEVQDIDEHETACGSESSLSDIEIIDEDLEEKEELTKSCFISSIFMCSLSVEEGSDACSRESDVSSETNSSISIYSGEIKDKPEDSETSNYFLKNETNSSISPDSEEIKDKPEDTKTINFCLKNGTNSSISLDSEDIKDKPEDSKASNADIDQSASPWINFGNSLHDWIALFLEFLQNLSGIQWKYILAVALPIYLYFYDPFNQTNIMAMHQKGNVVSQMGKMFDELRNDTKLFKEQIISEIKNEKLVSPFEHQIRELKIENSKLNRMLYDVVKVLEKQKNPQEKLLEKKETDYQVPFKNEINKIKEHINMLKFDIEKLQKQLEQKIYASYPQSKHTNTKEFGKDKHKTNFEGDTKDEKSHMTKKHEYNAKVKEEFCTETLLDLKLLKKWNNLIDQIIIELRLLHKDKTEETVYVKSDSETEKESCWSWKGFKGFINLSKLHAFELVSKCKTLSKEVFLKIYKSASSYFYNAKEITQSCFEDSQTIKEYSDEESKLWNIINDLGDTLVQMIKKVLDSYQKAKFSIYDYFGKSNVQQDAQGDLNMKQKIIEITFEFCHVLFVSLPFLTVILYLLNN